jgi:hypothetical protein
VVGEPVTAPLAATYDAERRRLARIVYALLGSHAEAEDVVGSAGGDVSPRPRASWRTASRPADRVRHVVEGL